MFGFELAYIDPGSGSLLIQGAIAALVAAGVFFRGQIARLIPGRRDHDDASSASTSTTPPTSASSASVDDAAKGG